MISELKGVLAYKAEDHIIIDVNGVGYELAIPTKILETLPDEGTPVHFFVYTHVTESSLALFGFSSRREKNLFKKLLTVSGIGPKSAVQILSGLGVEELIEAITTENLARLTGISGIGKKTAERLLVDLKDKMLDFVAAGDVGKVSNLFSPARGVLSEVFSALMNLGYQRSLADKAVAELKGSENMTFEQAFRKALTLLAPQ